MLVWGSVSAWRRQLAEDGPLPFFAKLQRRGVTVTQAEEAVGLRQLAAAVGRCATCAELKACRAGRPVDCPNRAFFERVVHG
jgi:hypothetical protein